MKSYTVKQIADMFGTTPETVRRWIRTGKLQAEKTSNKAGNVVLASALDSFVRTCPKYLTETAAADRAKETAEERNRFESNIAKKVSEIQTALENFSDETAISIFLKSEIVACKKIIGEKKSNIKEIEKEIREEEIRMCALDRVVRQLTSK